MYIGLDIFHGFRHLLGLDTFLTGKGELLCIVFSDWHLSLNNAQVISTFFYFYSLLAFFILSTE